MAENKMIFVGGKESFISRVLIKKVLDAGVDTKFVKFDVNEINKNIDGASLITLYIDDMYRPSEDLMHFLVDLMYENELKLILIAEQNDFASIEKSIPVDLIYKKFSRPVDNTEFTTTVLEYFSRADTGEFKKSILIVDDDAQYLQMVREWLKGTYKVAMANSGMQAIKWLSKNKVDLILLDHEMPVTSGPQVLEMLRSDPETSKIPVMFLTGKDDKESVMEVLSLRPESYFLKTISSQELLEKLQEFFILHN